MEIIEDSTAGTTGFNFKSFNANDWKRIEDIPHHIREVGNMMKEEGTKLAYNQPKLEKSTPISFDPAFVRRLFKEFCPGQGQTEETPQKKGKINVKEKIKLNTWKNDIEKIYQGRKSPTFPRVEQFGQRPEPWTFAVTQWLKNSKVSVVDRLYSGETFLEKMISDSDIETTLTAFVETALEKLRNIPLTEFLPRIIEEENFLIQPSFRGLRPLELYPEQVKIARAIQKCLRAKFEMVSPVLQENDSPFPKPAELPAAFIRFSTPPSSGKSSAAGYLGALLGEIHKILYSEIKFQRPFRRSFIVYSCYSNAVRLDVAKACIGAAVPFAILTDSVAVPSYNCYNGRPPKKSGGPPLTDKIKYSMQLINKCDKVPVVLVCDTKSAIEWLIFNENLTQNTLGDILLLDEPTAYLDDKVVMGTSGHTGIPEEHAILLRAAPPITVLMSATLPEFSNMPRVIQRFQEKYPHTSLIDVDSLKISSPCTIVDGAQQVFAPHHIIDAPIGEVVNLLADNNYLLRFYSPRALACLVADVGAFPDLLFRIEQATAANIWNFNLCRTFAFNILRDLPPTATLFRGPKFDAYRPPEVERMFTTQADAFPGTSITIAEDASMLCDLAFPALLEGVPRLHSSLKARETLMAKQKTFKEHVPGKRAPGDDDCDKGEKISQLDRLRDVDEVAEVPLWPARACINTKLHAKRFGTALDPQNFKTLPALDEDIITATNSDLVERLFSGVGCLDAPLSDNSYNIATLDIAEKSVLSFITSGRGIIFGVNLPCDRVIVLLEHQHCTFDILKQAVGRAGRTGKYRKSEVVFCDKFNLKILCKCPKYSEGALVPDTRTLFDMYMTS